MLIQCGGSVVSDKAGGRNSTSCINRRHPSYRGDFFQMVVVLSQCSKERDSSTPILVRCSLCFICICVLLLCLNVALFCCGVGTTLSELTWYYYLCSAIISSYYVIVFVKRLKDHNESNVSCQSIETTVTGGVLCCWHAYRLFLLN